MDVAVHTCAMFRVWFNKNDEATTTPLLGRQNILRLKSIEFVQAMEINRVATLRLYLEFTTVQEARIVFQKIDKNCVK